MAETKAAYETCPLCGSPTRLDRLDGLLRCSERPADCSWTILQGDPRQSATPDYAAGKSTSSDVASGRVDDRG